MASNCNCSESATSTAYWIGGMYKFAVNMTCDGFDMDTDDWAITITRGLNSVSFTPENSVHEVENEGTENEISQWYICLDTDGFKPGDAYITYEASVPDDDFPEGIRKEVSESYFCNFKSLKKK